MGGPTKKSPNGERLSAIESTLGSLKDGITESNHLTGLQLVEFRVALADDRQRLGDHLVECARESEHLAGVDRDLSVVKAAQLVSEAKLNAAQQTLSAISEMRSSLKAVVGLMPYVRAIVYGGGLLMAAVVTLLVSILTHQFSFP